VERCAKLDVAADLLDARRDDVIDDLVLEHGKPIAEAQAELTETVDQIHLCAAYGRTFGPTVPPLLDPRKRLVMTEEPLGVIGVITPWNFPLYVPVEYLAPALAMGNSVLWKPAESTPLTNRHLYGALRDSGFGTDELQLLEGGPETGRAVVCQAELAALCFTGSTEVGDEIRRLSAGFPLLLELGGNGPTIVLDGADIGAAAQSIAAASFWASGQSCSATERVLVHERCAEELTDAIVEQARSWVVGDPREERTTVGPLHLADTARKMEDHISDAVDRGSRILTGGKAISSFPTDRYWPATVAVDVPSDAQIFMEETFGPIVPISRVHSDDEATHLAALGNWGLVAAVFASDVNRAHRIADALTAGVVVINDNSNWWEPQVPYGGGPGTRSGTGRLGIENALRFSSSTKVVAVHVTESDIA
jgi:acyl-CoA reductase-like NAD-dependent aldehyde dehydrogenase